MKVRGFWRGFGSGSGDGAELPVQPSPGSQSPAPISGRIFRIVDDQLAEERGTKTSLETRASDVIKTSGTLTTLFLAIGAITGAASVRLEWWSVAAFTAAVLGFVVSACVAISVASPRAYEELKIKDLQGIMSPEIFAESEYTAGPKLTQPYLVMLQAARAANRKKAKRLLIAIRFEVAGVVLAAAAAVSTLISSAIAH